jgi:arginine/serine-rich splicing factor 4/5/6
MAEEPDAADVADAATASSDQGEVIGSSALRPVFLGNLMNVYTPEDVTAIFERPQQPKGDKVYTPVPVDRIDLKRGYCFVFLKDAVTQEDKINAERFVSAINGM